MKVCSRGTAIVEVWEIEQNQIKNLPVGWSVDPRFIRLLDTGFIWPVDGVGKRLDWPFKEINYEDGPLPESDEDSPQDPIELEPMVWPLAEDYLQRNSRTVLKNLKNDELELYKVSSMIDVEEAKEKPRKSVLKALRGMLA